MAKHGIPKPKFKEFMTDNAQANWNAVRAIIGSGDATILIKDQERTCLFYWTQSLKKYTKVDVRVDLQDQHRQLYRPYKNAALPSEIRDSLSCHSSIMALHQGCDKVGIELTRALVGILVLPLPPMGWLHIVGKLLIHLLAIVNVHCICF
jgi:hypothetical protein